jgi:sulfate adenylyltransferase subunit 1
MNWYNERTLLERLELLPVHTKDQTLPLRLPVQLVIRPHSDDHHDFRGYAGKIESGRLEKGEEITVLPSLKKTRITRILHASKEVDAAVSGQSITIELENDVDVSRGNMIVSTNNEFAQVNAFTATIAWMEEQVLTSGKTYILQHGTHTTKAKITGLQNRLDITTMEIATEVQQFGLNDIGAVTIKTARPVYADLYRKNPANGAFILIDEFSNNTVAVGFMESY